MSAETNTNETENLAVHESATLWSVPQLDGLQLLRANFVTYAFKRHMHDYFVIGMIEEGVQQFAYRRSQYVTPTTGLIVINPGEAHTGESAVPAGFRYRALYPEAEIMRQIASEIKGRQTDIPFFSTPVIQDTALFEEIRRLHTNLEANLPALEYQSRYLWTMAQLIRRHADSRLNPNSVKRERAEVRRIRGYIDEHYGEDIKLADLTALVNWNAYYLLRVFRNEVGLPPHAYLENVRVKAAQRLLAGTLSIAEVAYTTGFSSQSHLTTTFKRLIGVTPGQYARQVNFLKDSPAPPALS